MYFCILLLVQLAERLDSAAIPPTGSVMLRVLEFDDVNIKVFAQVPFKEHSVCLELIRVYDETRRQSLECVCFNKSRLQTGTIIYTFENKWLTSFLFHYYLLEITLQNCHQDCKYNLTFDTDPFNCRNWTADVHFLNISFRENITFNFALNPAFSNCPFDEFTVSFYNTSNQDEYWVNSQIISNVTKMEVITITFPNVHPEYIRIWPSKPFCKFCAIDYPFPKSPAMNGSEEGQLVTPVESHSYFISFGILPASCCLLLITIGILFGLAIRETMRRKECQDQVHISDTHSMSREDKQDLLTLWLVYKHGPEKLLFAVQKLALFLEEWMSVRVILDVREKDRILFNSESWIETSLEAASGIVVVESYESAAQWLDVVLNQPLREIGPQGLLSHIFEKCAKKLLKSKDKFIAVVNFWSLGDTPEFTRSVFQHYFRYSLEKPDECTLLYQYLNAQKPWRPATTCHFYMELLAAMEDYRKDALKYVDIYAEESRFQSKSTFSEIG